ncbi:6738_t:CDS:2, partial [Dentiscutata heterogama]
SESASVLLDNKIYIHGGISEGLFLSDLFYLDVSSSFNINDISSMPWVNLPSSPLTRTSGTACIDGANKNQIIFIGGYGMAGNNFSSMYNITTQEWNNLNAPANYNATFIKCILSGDVIYIYGGTGNTMIKLDTLNLTWTESLLVPSLNAIQAYGVALLDNTSILYIGGSPGDTANITLEKIKVKLYNITTDSMIPISTTGNIPSLRFDHGAIFISEFNQVLILYGYPDSSIMALDTHKFEWTSPTISNGGPSATLRQFTSILIGTYIFIAFGASNVEGKNSTNNVFLLDVSQKDNYKWVTSYDPTKTFQSTSITSDTSKDSSPINPSKTIQSPSTTSETLQNSSFLNSVITVSITIVSIVSFGGIVKIIIFISEKIEDKKLIKHATNILTARIQKSNIFEIYYRHNYYKPISFVCVDTTILGEQWAVATPSQVISTAVLSPKNTVTTNENKNNNSITLFQNNSTKISKEINVMNNENSSASTTTSATSTAFTTTSATSYRNTSLPKIDFVSILINSKNELFSQALTVDPKMFI